MFRSGVSFRVLSQTNPPHSTAANSFRFRSYEKRRILHHFGANKSFRIRSYKNTVGGVPPTLPRHPSLPPSYAPRGASIPCCLSRLRILAVTTGVYPLLPNNAVARLRMIPIL